MANIGHNLTINRKLHRWCAWNRTQGWTHWSTYVGSPRLNIKHQWQLCQLHCSSPAKTYLSESNCEYSHIIIRRFIIIFGMNGDFQNVKNYSFFGSWIEILSSYFNFPPAVKVIKCFWKQSQWQKNIKWKTKYNAWACSYLQSNTNFMQKYALKLFIAFEITYSCCFSKVEFLQKSLITSTNAMTFQHTKNFKCFCCFQHWVLNSKKELGVMFYNICNT